MHQWQTLQGSFPVFYPAVWNEFVQQKYCRGAQQREYPEWHKQRERYFIWAIDADTRELQERINRYKNSLKPYLVDNYHRQPHITLAVSGFLSEQPQHNDDIAPATIDQQVQALKALALKPFTLTVGGANSFATAPFLEVKEQCNTLEIIRQVFNSTHNDFRTMRYVPHITLGIYNHDHPAASITAKMIDVHEEALEIPVQRVVLYSYAASDIGSALREERVVWIDGVECG